MLAHHPGSSRESKTKMDIFKSSVFAETANRSYKIHHQSVPYPGIFEEYLLIPLMVLKHKTFCSLSCVWTKICTCWNIFKTPRYGYC